jgi:hypothetical protein
MKEKIIVFRVLVYIYLFINNYGTSSKEIIHSNSSVNKLLDAEPYGQRLVSQTQNVYIICITVHRSPRFYAEHGYISVLLAGLDVFHMYSNARLKGKQTNLMYVKIQ